MKCILLCAGYSMDENLQIRETAKSLTMISGKPLVNYTIEALDNIAIIDEIYLVTNGVYYDKFIEWYNTYTFTTKVKVINDNTTSAEAKLGAIGDIQYTINVEGIEDDIFVLAGDVYFDFSLEKMVNYYVDKKEPVVAGMYTEDTGLLSKFGVIEEINSIIVRMQEKPVEPKGNILSLAAYIFPKDVLRVINEYLSEGYQRTYPGYFLEYLYRMRPVYVHKVACINYDINNRQAIEKLEQKLASLFDK